jgi:hypothetical protein
VRKRSSSTDTVGHVGPPRTRNLRRGSMPDVFDIQKAYTPSFTPSLKVIS